MTVQSLSNRKKCNFVTVKLTKSILLIVLVLGLTVPKGFWYFTVHIAAFVVHFHHYYIEHGHVAVPDFIAERIHDNDHRGKHQHNHSHLPLHHQHSSDNNQTLAFLFLSSREMTFLVYFVSSSLTVTNRQLFQSSEFFKTIWQPPKMS
jgi:hypothetical protein